MTFPFPPRKPARPFGGTPPFDPRTGAHVPLQDTSPFAEFTVVEVGHDALLCTDRDGKPALIAKPWALRKTSFDGETIGGVAFASAGLDERTATDVGALAEEVSPAYAVGEKVMALRRAFRDVVLAAVGAAELTDIAAGSHRLWWEDLNTAGRRWAGVAGIVATITGGAGPTYTWALAHGSGPATGSATELNGSVGIVAGTVVVLLEADGAYRFFFPVEECD